MIEFNNFLSRSEVHLENNVKINEHNKVKHIIVTSDCFKLSLMLLQTNKSKEIRKYYIENIDYKHINMLEFNKILSSSDLHLENNVKINKHNKVKHLILSYDYFFEDKIIITINHNHFFNHIHNQYTNLRYDYILIYH
jgi:hypothetical protein